MHKYLYVWCRYMNECAICHFVVSLSYDAKSCLREISRFGKSDTWQVCKKCNRKNGRRNDSPASLAVDTAPYWAEECSVAGV